MLYDHWLELHRVVIAADGSISDQTETADDALPVPDSS